MPNRDGLQNGSSLDVNGNASPVIPRRTSHDGGTLEGHPLAFLQTRDNPTTQQKGGSSTQAFAAPSPAPIISSSSSLPSTLNVDAEPVGGRRPGQEVVGTEKDAAKERTKEVKGTRTSLDPAGARHTLPSIRTTFGAAPSSSDGQGQQLGDRSPGARSGSPSMSSAQSQHTYASADHLWGLMQSAMSLSTTAPPSATSLVNDAARKEELSKSLSVPEQETSVERPPISLRAQADINERSLLRSSSVAGPESREKSEGAGAAEEASKASFISAQMLLMRLQSCRQGEVIEHSNADSLSSAAPRGTNHDEEDEAEAKRGDESDGLVGKTASKSSEQRDDASCLRGIKSVADADTSWRYTGIASANGPDFGYLDSRPPRASDPMNWDLAAAVAAFPASSGSWPQPLAGKESTSSTANEYASPATSTTHFDQLARAEPLILIVLRKPSSLPFPPSRGVHEADRAICTTIGAVRVGLPPTPDKATSHVAENFELADNSISLLALESYCLDDMSKRRLSHVVSTSLSEPGASAVAGLSSMPAAVVGRMASSSRQRRRWAKDVVIINSYDDDDELAEAQTSSSEAECSASYTSTSSSSSLPVTPDKGGSQSRHRSPQAFLDAIHCLSSPPPSSSSSSPSLCDPHPCPKSTSSLSPSSSPASSLASSSAQTQELKRLPVNWFYVEGGIASLRNTTPGFGPPNNARQMSASSSLARLSLNGAKQQDVPSSRQEFDIEITRDDRLDRFSHYQVAHLGN
ncbi:hypothetical protein FA10DRAFT_289148 [Acaromyces ingoldii]|uniref:Uncharacterized protein n=1 Tax=Acaromyces ingoldii TaxID=215250 RepID=A0A316YC15_9BASI|nr:hypothetical protein FA10DRAFT_289148 [Acaromyces ingoldii]PWN87066.1 hypothetical protein FA10DRAFT_289148 [Acaromyces ingoldii]